MANVNDDSDDGCVNNNKKNSKGDNKTGKNEEKNC